AVELAALRRTLPAGPAAGAAADVGEGVGPLRPVRPPQALAAGHAGLAVDMGLGQFGDEARGDGRGPLAVDAAVGGVDDEAAPARAGDRDISEAALLLEAG